MHVALFSLYHPSRANTLKLVLNGRRPKTALVRKNNKQRASAYQKKMDLLCSKMTVFSTGQQLQNSKINQNPINRCNDWYEDSLKIVLSVVITITSDYSRYNFSRSLLQELPFSKMLL